MSIHFEKVSHIYSPKTPFEFKALEDITMDFSVGKITAIVGATGSGKTTLVQHLNGLLLPTVGEVNVDQFTIKAGEKLKNVKELRKNVGLVFQFSEYQLFEETILKDVAFGPRNFGVAEDEAMKIAAAALVTCGIDPSNFEKSPLELSGGNKRRVAIAGILAMKPAVLVLDEPTAGLDPQGAKTMMELFRLLNKKEGTTVLIVTHNMEHVLDYCDEVVVLEKGKLAMHTDVKTFFESSDFMSKAAIDPPTVIQFKQLCQKHGVTFDASVLSVDELANQIAKRCKK